MARTVSARQQGDEYQARAFWLKACRLFQPHTKVNKVGYELEEMPHFDDIAVFYGDGASGWHGNALDADYYQVKWHVDQSGSLTCESLVNPEFIGSHRSSLLQRLKESFEVAHNRGESARFNFVTTWGIESRDPLGLLISGTDGQIRLDRLFNPSAPGPVRRVRDEWMSHLDVDESTLRRILSTFRLCAGSFNLDRLTRELSDRLAAVGLAPIEFRSLSNRYDGLIRALQHRGLTVFTRDDIIEICESESLLVDSSSEPNLPVVGIRSFLRFAEHLEDETESLLDLADLFDGRRIRSADLWNDQVSKRIHAYVNESVVHTGNCVIHLAAHSSIAFAAGYELDLKAGMNVSPIQSSSSGRAIWTAEPTVPTKGQGGWRINELEVNPEGREVGLAISVTHSTKEDAIVFAGRQLASLGRLLVLEIEPEVGFASVRNGPHAWHLAEDVIKIVREWDGFRIREGSLHIFSAAPNGLVFFLGRLSRSLGSIQLYEHDFDTNEPGAYSASLKLPLK